MATNHTFCVVAPTMPIDRAPLAQAAPATKSGREGGRAGGPPIAGAGALGDHIAMLKKHIDTNQEKFRRRRDEIARFHFSKMVEIDEKGTAVINEDDLVEYCEGLASLFDEEEPGLAKKLEQEIRRQKTRFGSGTLQPLLKTNIIGVDNAGAFSVVQVCATWDKSQIEVRYSQMGRSWSVPRGQPSPQTEVMLDYYQYKAVGIMLEMLGAAAPREGVAAQRYEGAAAAKTGEDIDGDKKIQSKGFCVVAPSMPVDRAPVAPTVPVAKTPAAPAAPATKNVVAPAMPMDRAPVAPMVPVAKTPIAPAAPATKSGATKNGKEGSAAAKTGEDIDGDKKIQSKGFCVVAPSMPMDRAPVAPMAPAAPATKNGKEGPAAAKTSDIGVCIAWWEKQRAQTVC